MEVATQPPGPFFGGRGPSASAVADPPIGARRLNLKAEFGLHGSGSETEGGAEHELPGIDDAVGPRPAVGIYGERLEAAHHAGGQLFPNLFCRGRGWATQRDETDGEQARGSRVKIVGHFSLGS